MDHEVKGGLGAEGEKVQNKIRFAFNAISRALAARLT